MRTLLFLVPVLGIWAAIHGYVFWRLATVPIVKASIPFRTLLLIAVGMWASFPLVHFLSSQRLGILLKPLEFISGNWIGVLFLLFAALLVVDTFTLGGFLLPRMAPGLQGWAVVVALTLSVVALVQGMRPPVVRDYEVQLAGLPRECDGLVLAGISDTHLGSLIGRGWIEDVVSRINAFHPDIVVILGDIVEGHYDREEQFLPVFRSLRAPLGVWAVIGNHEYYTGTERSVRFFEEAGFTVLRDRWVEILPGLTIAGVDDLTARRRRGIDDKPVERALSNCPPGAAILLSHSPLQAERAAGAGADLMLSGHTHNGQIWPFNYITRLSYPLVGGRYEVNGMTVIVCRGTGTWGSRMRLWSPGEILRIRLKLKPK